MENQLDCLKYFTQKEGLLDELSVYTKNQFITENLDLAIYTTLPEDPQVSTWKNYIAISEEIGVYRMLKRYLFPFQFPIREGISQTKSYKAASLKGHFPNNLEETTGLILQNPDKLKLRMYESVAGAIPVLIVPDKGDFKTVIQALAYKNEPKPIPHSMGAGIMKGLNNWDRIQKIKKKWESEPGSGTWQNYFKHTVLPNRSLYQDTLIVLSKKPYSGVEAHQLNLPEDEWLKYSLEIRLEHECAHYFTLRYLGGMYSNMHDELIADYMGITKALGYFNPNWFLAFIGMVGKSYKTGGRLENYLGTPGLSKEAFEVLQQIMIKATKHVAAFNHYIRSYSMSENRVDQLLTLGSLSLAEIAAPQGDQKLIDCHARLLEKRFSF